MISIRTTEAVATSPDLTRIARYFRDVSAKRKWADFQLDFFNDENYSDELPYSHQDLYHLIHSLGYLYYKDDDGFLLKEKHNELKLGSTHYSVGLNQKALIELGAAVDAYDAGSHEPTHHTDNQVSRDIELTRFERIVKSQTNKEFGEALLDYMELLRRDKHLFDRLSEAADTEYHREAAKLLQGEKETDTSTRSLCAKLNKIITDNPETHDGLMSFNAWYIGVNSNLGADAKELRVVWELEDFIEKNPQLNIASELIGELQALKKDAKWSVGTQFKYIKERFETSFWGGWNQLNQLYEMVRRTPSEALLASTSTNSAALLNEGVLHEEYDEFIAGKQSIVKRHDYEGMAIRVHEQAQALLGSHTDTHTVASHSMADVKVSLDLRGKSLLLVQGSNRVTVHTYRSTSDATYRACKALMDANGSPISKDALGVSGKTTLKDLPNNMGFTGALRREFIIWDSAAKTLTLQKSGVISTKELQEIEKASIRK